MLLVVLSRERNVTKIFQAKKFMKTILSRKTKGTNWEEGGLGAGGKI